MTAVARAHLLQAVEFNATALPGITQLSIRTGTQTRAEARSGEVYARIRSLIAQQPGASFASEDVAAALALCGLTGTDIGGLAAGLNLYVQALDDGGIRTAGATHRKYTIWEGLVIPRSLDCQHRGDASIRYDALATHDGTHDPLVMADNAALPVISAAARFTLGPVTIGAVTIPEIRSLSVDFGIQARTEGADSDYWDTLAYIQTIVPVITLRGIDVEWLKAANIPLLGKAATHANTTLYLRKRAAGGTFVANATAEHISITAAGLAVIDTPFDASGHEPGEATLTLATVYDGTNLPLVISTTATLPA